jgi:hypothetical protein
VSTKIEDKLEEDLDIVFEQFIQNKYVEKIAE